MRRTIQVYIHRYYEGIKLSMLVILIMLSVFTILSQIAQNDRDARQRSADVANVAKAVKAESEKQTDIINRQFRALCIIILETSGQEGLDKLDPESKERCENLDKAISEEVAAPEQDPNTPQSQPQGNTSLTLPNNSTNGNNNLPDNSQNSPNNGQPPVTQPPTPPPPKDESILPIVEEPVIGCVNPPIFLGRTCI